MYVLTNYLSIINLLPSSNSSFKNTTDSTPNTSLAFNYVDSYICVYPEIITGGGTGIFTSVKAVQSTSAPSNKSPENTLSIRIITSLFVIPKD